jgi:predicted PilT family ATPase
VNVGFDDASLSYIKKKIDLASSIGIRFQLHQFIEKQESSIHLHRNFEKIRKSSKEGDIRLYNCESESP